MNITPDHVIFTTWGPFSLNLTIVITWATMAGLVFCSWLVTRKLRTGTTISRWQSVLEVIVGFVRNQIRDTGIKNPDRFLPLIGTLFVFIAVCNTLSAVPWYIPPTSSLSTTTALALCVFLAVPLYGIRAIGLRAYLRNYLRPTPLMLPFNIMGEISRTLALAVRLFGNIMSANMIGAVLLLVIPLFFPVLMQLLGLLTGLIQAYIFSILAIVYIAAGMEHQD